MWTLADIVLVNITHHPDASQVGDREKVGGIIQALDAFETGYILLHDGSRNGRTQFDQGTGMSGISANYPEAAFSSLEIGLGLVFGILRNLQIFLRDCPVRVKKFSAFQGFAGQLFISSDAFW